MTLPRITAALCLLATLALPLAAQPDNSPADSPPAYDVLYFAGREALDRPGPNAAVRTDARSEDEWLAIGRDLRAKHPALDVVVAHIYSDQAPPLPKGYPSCSAEMRKSLERWMLGSYVYQSKDFKFNSTGAPIESVSQSVIDPKQRTLAGIDVTQLRAPDPKQAIAAPATTRIISIAVVVPGLGQQDLEKVAAAYETEYQTPLLLQVVFFAEIPDWPDKPFANQGLYEHAARSYARSGTIKYAGANPEVVPVDPQWWSPPTSDEDDDTDAR